MSVLVDSSAWVEYVRGTGSPAERRVRELVTSSDEVTTDPVILEVVGGSRSTQQVHQLKRLLAHARYVPQAPQQDVLAAIDIYQRCRRAGETVRSLNDCLIAAIAIRCQLPVLHRDRDFDAMARHSDLEVVSV